MSAQPMNPTAGGSTGSVGGRVNEVAKHAFILMMLAASFFPLYVMVNVSFKTNKQFYRNPWTPEFPLHAENWAAGWQTIGSSVPTSPKILNVFPLPFPKLVL